MAVIVQTNVVVVIFVIIIVNVVVIVVVLLSRPARPEGRSSGLPRDGGEEVAGGRDLARQLLGGGRGGGRSCHGRGGRGGEGNGLGREKDLGNCQRNKKRGESATAETSLELFHLFGATLLSASLFQFLDAPSHLYMRSCPFVRPSVGP